MVYMDIPKEFLYISSVDHSWFLEPIDLSSSRCHQSAPAIELIQGFANLILVHSGRESDIMKPLHIRSAVLLSFIRHRLPLYRLVQIWSGKTTKVPKPLSGTIDQCIAYKINFSVFLA